MILADTSIWIDYLAREDHALRTLLQQDKILVHPLLIGELAMGNLRNRANILGFLHELPFAAFVLNAEVLELLETHLLFGRGIGYIDAHLLASVRATAGASLWTRDRRLHDIATELGVAYTG
ncbi:MAG: type II toxin-antitoxin system VapC family toxin [Acidobacteria bacterium]|nr:type II toxin-antitoxin system VapC family toxin [Acidobacteriota bacterium]